MAQEMFTDSSTKPRTMHYLHLEPADFFLLRGIKKELSFRSFREVIKRVICVLRAFRKILNTKQASIVINSLPDFFKLIFVANWSSSERPIVINHLDEFVTLVMAHDREQSVFKSEVEALSVSILVLKRVLALIHVEGENIISPTLIQQINEVPADAVAA
jgi:uncharacterized protein (DUF2267 family)